MLTLVKKVNTTLPWRLQWHVTADGTVIRERARGDQPHEQLFQSFVTTRPITVAELDALSQRLDHEVRRITPFDVLWWTGLMAFVVGLPLVGALVSNSVSGNPVPGLIIGAALCLVLSSPAFRLVMVFLPKDSVGAMQRLGQEAGIASSTGVTMRATEARALIQAPGTTSGIESRAKRA